MSNERSRTFQPHKGFGRAPKSTRGGACAPPDSPFPANREDSVACAVRSLLRSDFAGTALRRRSNRPVTVRMATEQRGYQLCCLHLADVLARAAGGFLSSPQRSTAALAGFFGNCISHRSQPVGNPLEERTTLHFHRLVLVCRDARARDRLGAGR